MTAQTTNEKIVYSFLQKKFPDFFQSYFVKIKEYVELLWEENQKINLISRKMSKNDYWLTHIYDSLSLSSYADLNEKKALDFGSGGGLPGIPLNIVYPTSKMYLLDATHKKMAAMEKIIKMLDLKSCFTIVSRLEEIENERVGSFDVIVCRSVKMEERYVPFLRKIVKKDGRIFLYKGRNFEDVGLFKSFLIHELNDEILGERKIIEINKREI
jgi:16S rRNA (guanine527-N7)-methyltransferase